jgi:hypothetical protein
MERPFIGGDVNDIFNCTQLFMFCKTLQISKIVKYHSKTAHSKKEISKNGYFVYIICREDVQSVCGIPRCVVIFCFVIKLFSAFGLYVYVVFHFVRIVM